MAESLVSGSWHRVADLRPSLVAGLRVVRQPVRGQVWHVLLEPASGRQLRLNPAAWDLVGRFDGRATVAELWQRVLHLRRDEAPTQDEALALLAQLFRGGMVQFDAAPHLSLLFARRAQEGEQRRRGFINPLMLRMRLLDPSPWLARATPLARLVFSRPVFLLWLLAVAAALLAAGANLLELRANALRLLATPSSYAMAWVIYPLVKALHELGHALAVRRYGGDVRELGVSLMLLTPAPYVDASAANAFPLPRQRLVVSAAGILVELAIAAAALALWFSLSAGLLRDAALAVVLVCSISTLLFNGNPFLRLDGYYVLCDALQLPNLAARSQAWWARQWGRVAGGDDGAQPLLAPGERKWLAIYAPLAWVYRVALLAGLVAWLGHQAWLAGCIAAVVVAAWLLRGSWTWLGMAGGRARRVGFALVLLALGAALAVPAPQNVVVQGVVWPPAGAQLRAEVAGFVEELRAADGASAVAGEPLLVMDDPALHAALERVAAEQSGLRAQQYAALLSDPATALRLQSEVARSDAERARIEQQLAQLAVRPALAGRVAWTRPQDLPGSFAARGTLLGHVVAPGPMHVRIALQQEDFSRVRGQVREVEVRLAEAPGDPREARLASALPGATQELPSAALGDRAGGPVPLEAGSKDGLRARAPVFLLDVEVPQAQADRIGARAWVKLSLPAQPLAQQVARRAAQLFVKQFNPTGQL